MGQSCVQNSPKKKLQLHSTGDFCRWLSDWKARWETGIITRNHQGAFPKKVPTPFVGVWNQLQNLSRLMGKWLPCSTLKTKKQHPLGEITSKNVTNASKKNCLQNIFFATCFFFTGRSCRSWMWPSSWPGGSFFQEGCFLDLLPIRWLKKRTGNKRCVKIMISHHQLAKLVFERKWSIVKPIRKKKQCRITHDAKGRHFIFTQELLSLQMIQLLFPVPNWVDVVYPVGIWLVFSKDSWGL